jgi:hypothetical protein
VTKVSAEAAGARDRVMRKIAQQTIAAFVEAGAILSVRGLFRSDLVMTLFWVRSMLGISRMQGALERIAKEAY